MRGHLAVVQHRLGVQDDWDSICTCGHPKFMHHEEPGMGCMYWDRRKEAHGGWCECDGYRATLVTLKAARIR